MAIVVTHRHNQGVITVVDLPCHQAIQNRNLGLRVKELDFLKDPSVNGIISVCNLIEPYRDATSRRIN